MIYQTTVLLFPGGFAMGFKYSTMRKESWSHHQGEYIVHRLFLSIVHSNSHYTLTSFEKASHCCNHVSQWANILATLPLGNGGMLVC